MNYVPVEIKVLNDVYVTNPLDYAMPGDAGIDLRSTVDCILQPGQSHKIPLGVAINIKLNGVMALIFPRSGLGSEGLVLGNLTGVIDNGYQGELIATAWNRTSGDSGKIISISKGQKICQMVFVPFLQAVMSQVDVFEPSVRGAAGFGSTGS